MNDEKCIQPKKKVWTDEERLEMAAKLDKELEDYIDNLDKRSYTDGWPEDRWQEEMEKHPFFMTQFPEDSNEVSPLIEGLQQLKYSDEYNTPNELAQVYKEDGNFNYKHKKYRLAILSFSKGISSECNDLDILSQLYNNRALAQLKLKNYRSSLNDCKQAIKLKPDYLKPVYTAAKCCFYVKEYDQCVNYCNQILSSLEKSKEIDNDIVTMRKEALKNKIILLRDSKVQKLKDMQAEEMKNKVVEAIKSRNIKLDKSDVFYDSQYHVHLDDDGSLIWPVIIAYPENNQTDFIQNFNENILLCEQLDELFEEPPAWDSDKRYQVDKLNIYFEGTDRKPRKVDIKQSLGNILQMEYFIVKNGTPLFFAVIANSKEELSFLKNYR